MSGKGINYVDKAIKKLKSMSMEDRQLRLYKIRYLKVILKRYVRREGRN